MPERVACRAAPRRLPAPSCPRRTALTPPAHPTHPPSTHLQVVAWYDNEWGYSQRVVDLAEVTAAKWE